MARAKAGAAAAATKKFTVISMLDHDNVLYEVGDTVEMTPDQAKPLLGNTLEAQEADEAKGAE